MPTVSIVDTCIFLNILDVPSFNQDRDVVLQELRSAITDPAVNLLLPFAAIVETGNHIGQLNDGRLRRIFADKFKNEVQLAIDGTAPWSPTQPSELLELRNILDRFPEHAQAGSGLGDLSIIKEWEDACERHPTYRVRIWTNDQHLSGYDRAETVIGRKVRRP